MNLITNDSYLQVATSPEGEVLTIHNERFPWSERKVKTVKLAKLYELAGFQDYANRAAACSTFLQFGFYSDGSQRLEKANFCQLRLCPLCISRRAKRAAYKLSHVLDQVEREHGAMFIFLTLTVKNVEGEQLGDALGRLTTGWNRLLQHRRVQRAVKGWFRAIEITRGDNRWHKDHKTGKMKFREDKGYHPHIHAILAVSPEYFSKDKDLYISHEEWVRRWRLALRADYDPSVSIETAKAKGEYTGGRAAATEAAKYSVKDSEYIDDTLPKERLVGIVRDYTLALHHRRLTAFGGWLKEAAKAQDAEDLDNGDLVHIDDDGIREDIAELIVTYGWHFGAGDYVLTNCYINPLRLAK